MTMNGEKYNGSGWTPVEFNCVILVDDVPKKIGSIHIPDDEVTNQQYASTVATLVAVSPLAFSYEIWPDGIAKPKPGDRVLISKYGGTMMKRPGEPGPDYRIVKDKDILAVSQ